MEAQIDFRQIQPLQQRDTMWKEIAHYESSTTTTTTKYRTNSTETTSFTRRYRTK